MKSQIMCLEEMKDDVPPRTEAPTAATEEKPSHERATLEKPSSEAMAERPVKPSQPKPESEQPAIAEPMLATVENLQKLRREDPPQ